MIDLAYLQSPDARDANGNRLGDGCTVVAAGKKCGAPISTWSWSPVRCPAHLSKEERAEARRHGGRGSQLVKFVEARG